MIIKCVLTGKKNFNDIYKKGKSIGDRYIVIFFKKNYLDYSRVAFLASKKVGNAVKRNRARRIMKEAYRNIEGFSIDGYDIIFIARNTIDNKKCFEVQKSMKSALKRAAIKGIKRWNI